MRRALRLAIIVSAAALTLGAAAATSGTAAFAESVAPTAYSAVNSGAKVADHASPSSVTLPHQAYDNCRSGYWCDYASTSGSKLCQEQSGTVRYWSNFGCRNVDESFANRTSGLVRLYYSPNLKGPWVCVDSGWYSNNLNNGAYKFNNGSGTGYGEKIINNVASSSTALGTCTNPLPEDG